MARDPRQASFLSRHFGKIGTAIAVALPLMWLMDTHLDYTNSENKGADNPGGYLVYGLKKANDDVGKTTTRLGELSDRITATVEGKPMPAQQKPVPLYMKPRTLRDFNVVLCVPRDLIDNNTWENPAPGSKMESFKNMLRDYILANGLRDIQYRIREDAFDKFDPAWQDNPSAFMAEVDARYQCPSTSYTAKILVPAR